MCRSILSISNLPISPLRFFFSNLFYMFNLIDTLQIIFFLSTFSLILIRVQQVKTNLARKFHKVGYLYDGIVVF